MKTSAVSWLLILLASFAAAQSVPDLMKQGISLWESGDAAGAAERFEQVIEHHPNHGPARLLLGQIALKQENWKQAREHLEIAAASNPQRPHLSWELLGNASLYLGDLTRALRCFEKSLALRPDSESAAMSMASTLILMKESDRALTELEKLQSRDALLLRSELLLHLGRKEEARSILEGSLAGDETAKLLLLAIGMDPAAGNKLKIALGNNLALPTAYAALGIYLRSDVLFRIASEIGFEPVWTLFSGVAQIVPPVTRDPLLQRPYHVPALLLQADTLEKSGDPWGAFLLYDRVSAWLPEVPAIEARRANLARTMGLFSHAECAARRALKVNPDDGSLHYLLAAVLYDAEKNEEALAQCRKAMELGMQSAPVYVTLGNLYYRKMMISESIVALEKAVELDPLAAESIASFALSEITAGDRNQLKNLLKKAVDSNPESINSLYSLGSLFLLDQELEKAKELFQRLAQLAPNRSQTVYNLALIHSRLGEQQQAAEAMSLFRQLKDEELREWDRQNQAHRIRLQAGEAFQRMDWAESARLYKRLASDGTARSMDYIRLGHSFMKLGDFTQAISAYESTLMSPPFDPEAITGLIEAAAASGKSNLAGMWQERLEALKCE